MSTEHDAAQMGERLERLERQYNRLRKEAWVWRCGCVMSALAVGCLLVLIAGRHSLLAPTTVECDTLRAREIIVTDNTGKTRILLTVLDNGYASQSFLAPEEKLLVVIGGNEKGGVASFHTRGDKSQVWTGHHTDGISGLRILDGAAVPRANVHLDANGTNLILRDAAGNVTFSKP